jgi:hypothetical protein
MSDNVKNSEKTAKQGGQVDAIVRRKLTIKESGEWDLPFGIYLYGDDGIAIEAIALFKEHKDALFFIDNVDKKSA